MAPARGDSAGGPLAALHARLDATIDAHVAEIVALAAIPAPSFEERERAAHGAARFRDAGLADVAVDGADNVRGHRAQAGAGA